MLPLRTLEVLLVGWLLLLLNFNMVSCILLRMEFGGCVASHGCRNSTEAKYNKSLQYIFQL